MFPASAQLQRVWKMDPGVTVRAPAHSRFTRWAACRLSYDAFWGTTPAVLEPGRRRTPLSEPVRADLAQTLPRLVSSALENVAAASPDPGSRSGAAAALGTADALPHAA